MRNNFVKIRDAYRTRGKGNVRLTQSSLLLIRPINNTSSNYIFPVLENDNTGGIIPEEVRLNMNDEFVITGMGLYLMATVKAGETTFNGKFPLTYPPMEVDAAQAGKLQVIYDGTLKLAVNNIVYVEKFDARRSKLIPRTEFQQTITAGGATALFSARIPSNDFAKDAMYPVQPMVTLSGAKKNEISLALPAAADSGTITYVDQKGTSISLVINAIGLMLRGYNAQNAAKFQ